MRLVFSFDDGDQLDVTKMAPLLEKYGYHAMFYVPSYFNGKNTLSPLELKQLISKGHQIGGHTKTHPQDLKLLCCDKLKAQIEDNKEWLEQVTGFHVESFCYPRGRYNQETIQRVRDAGFKEARTTVVGQIHTGFDAYKMPTTVHIFQREEYDGVPLLQYFKQCLADAEAMDLVDSQQEGYMHIWGHSAEIERESLWDTFEEMLKILRSKNYEDIYTK